MNVERLVFLANVQFDWTITLGNLVALGGSIAALSVWAWKVLSKRRERDVQLQILWRDFKRRNPKLPLNGNDD